MKAPFTSIGGQAVLEGVMMKSPRYLSLAVRLPTGEVTVEGKFYQSWAKRYALFRLPVFRGVASLFESMIHGMNALAESAQILSSAEELAASSGNPEAASSGVEGNALSNWAMAGTVFISILLGLLLFVALPHLLTVLGFSSAGFSTSGQDPLFHGVDGIIKAIILLLYIYLIGLTKDIKRVFQYHGAEHKSVYAFESGKELSIVNAKTFSTLHPRCGTSFLLFLVLTSILVFSTVLPFVSFIQVSNNIVLQHGILIFLKMLLMIPVAGLSYEFIKFCAFRMQNPFLKFLIWPGLKLQLLTTKEPDDQQLETALISLRHVLALEKGVIKVPGKMKVKNLSEMHETSASISEFLE